MDDSGFDQLARRVGATRSRRSVLGLLAGALALRGALTAGEAAAGNAAVAECCRAKFGPGRERGQCVADGAGGAGPCAPEPTGTCNSLRAYCGDVAGPCCEGLVCLNPPISRCQYFCDTTEECIQRFGNPNLVCAREIRECGGRRCCY